MPGNLRDPVFDPEGTSRDCSSARNAVWRILASLLVIGSLARGNPGGLPVLAATLQPDKCVLCRYSPAGPVYVDAPEPSRSAISLPRTAAADAVSDSRVRVAYVIPSNRTPQPDALARIRNALRLVQRFYRDQMQKHGYGSRSFRLETEADGVTPRVHVVNVPQTDATLRGKPDTLEHWDNVNKAAEAMGIPLWARDQVWLMIPEIHLQLENGDVLGNVFLGAGFESSGSTGGVCMMGSNALAALQPAYFTDDRAFAGLRIAELGPYPLKTIVGGEGSTLSSASTSIIGGLAHELGHAFGLAHDYRNDENFHGNLMGNGLRGIRGNLFPGRYPADYTDLSVFAARALSVSRYFGGASENDTAPTIEGVLSGAAAPANGVIEIPFTARSSSVLALAYLVDHEGVVLADRPLTGSTASAAFVTSSFTPSAQNSYRIAVYDTNGNRRYANVSLAVGSAAVRAPRPHVKVARPIAMMGESLQLDASGSSDPTYPGSELSVEWDLNGDGNFDTAPSKTKTLTIPADEAGIRRVTMRVTNPASVRSVSAPLIIQTEAAILLPKPGANGQVTLEWIGSLGVLYRIQRSSNQTNWSDAGIPLFVGTGEKISYAPSAGDTTGVFFRLVAQRQLEMEVSLPLIVTTPASTAVDGGGSSTLSVVAGGPGPTTYQWQKDGIAIPDATHNTLTFVATAANDAGSYAVMISNSAGSVATTTATLTVQTSRLTNLSIRCTAGTGEETLIVGFAIGGTGAKQILLRGIGPSLAQFGVADAVRNPRLSLYDGARLIAENEDWGGGSALSGAFTAAGAFPLPSSSQDAALLVQLATRFYSVQLTASGGSGVALVEAYDADGNSPPTRFINLSARNRINGASDALIVGFVISGNATKTLLIRAIGPSLSQFGVGSALADPQLTVFDRTNVTIAQNDDWRGESALNGAFARVGAFPVAATSKDAALLVSLPPGSYTAQATGVNNSTGIALVEVYEISP